MENSLCSKGCRIFIIIIVSGLLLGHTQGVYGQQDNVKIKISRPEFLWALSHPFKVKRALKITHIALFVTDSLEKDSNLKDRSGGQLDAFKHGLWMAFLSQEIGSKAALKLGIAHEKSNYINFKKGRPYSSHKHSVMDSLNNIVGIKIGGRLNDRDSIIKAIFIGVKKGDFYMLNKNTDGQYIDCKGNIIEIDSSRWERNECIIRT